MGEGFPDLLGPERTPLGASDPPRVEPDEQGPSGLRLGPRGFAPARETTPRYDFAELLDLVRGAAESMQTMRHRLHDLERTAHSTLQSTMTELEHTKNVAAALERKLAASQQRAREAEGRLSDALFRLHEAEAMRDDAAAWLDYLHKIIFDKLGVSMRSRQADATASKDI